MKAMIFAAGLGSRLRPLTDTRPKALAEVDGVPLLEIVLGRLRAAGVNEVVINLHHLGAQIREFMGARGDFGLRVIYSDEEDQLLDTGGGLKKAAAFFDDGRPFLLHNVDVLSDVDLLAVMRAHEAAGALVTLVAKERPTARPLLFDEDGRLCGRVGPAGEEIVRPPAGALVRLGFCGIHAVSPAILPRLSETGTFAIVTSYLRLAGEGAAIRVYRADTARWRDAGRPEDLRPL